MTRKRQRGLFIKLTIIATYMSAVAGLCFYASIMFAFEGRFWPMLAFDALFVVATIALIECNEKIMRLAS